MPGLTTHVLDTGIGKPADGIAVSVYRKTGETWEEIGNGKTNDDGRVEALLPSEFNVLPGVYRLIFESEPYFRRQKRETFYPSVEIIFEIKTADSHYHVPLLISGFGYSTYRGS